MIPWFCRLETFLSSDSLVPLSGLRGCCGEAHVRRISKYAPNQRERRRLAFGTAAGTPARAQHGAVDFLTSPTCLWTHCLSVAYGIRACQRL
jgi:hypothetical protein